MGRFPDNQIDRVAQIIVRSSWFFHQRVLRARLHLCECIPCHADRYQGLVMSFTAVEKIA